MYCRFRNLDIRISSFFVKLYFRIWRQQTILLQQILWTSIRHRTTTSGTIIVYSQSAEKMSNFSSIKRRSLFSSSPIASIIHQRSRHSRPGGRHPTSRNVADDEWPPSLPPREFVAVASWRVRPSRLVHYLAIPAIRAIHQVTSISPRITVILSQFKIP